MNHFRQGRRWVVLVPVAALFIFSAAGQNIPNSTKGSAPVPPLPGIVSPAMAPPLPSTPSPVDYFRKLLAMSPQQLQAALAHKPPKVQERILAKIKEYAALDPDDRELRLRATELRWYLMPILQAPASQRAAQLALVPADIRALVQSRLTQWDVLPPGLQQEFLGNGPSGYFAGLTTTNGNTETQTPNIFDVSPAEVRQTFVKLTDAEREQMEATLDAFGKLPPHQRVQCIRAFGKFTNMSSAERVSFLRNAQRWSQMTASERQAWRDLVAHVPQWSPLPTAAIVPPPMPNMPPMPPMPSVQQSLHAVAATNHG